MVVLAVAMKLNLAHRKKFTGGEVSKDWEKDNEMVWGFI